MLTFEQVNEKIWVIYGSTPSTVAHAFIRFQEYYENPVYKGKPDLSIEDVEAWWAQQSDSSYYDSWAGFNIPGRVFLELRNKLKLPTVLEHALISGLNTLKDEQLQDGYIIGVGESDPNFELVLQHELAHALFATNPTYRRKQLQNVMEIEYPLFEKIVLALRDMGYHASVIPDEIQAYMLTDLEDLESAASFDLQEIAAPFKVVYERFQLKPKYNREMYLAQILG